MNVITKGKCPTCNGCGEAEFTHPVVVIGTDIVALAHEILVGRAEEYGLSPGDLAGPSRASRLLEPRYKAAEDMRALGMTLESIGRILGGRDHSTIIYGLKKLSSWEVSR